ncbi:MAG: DnaJ domain-containing protein [Bradymonadaceae bacterium]
MYPFHVLGLDYQTTDDEVRRRYDELVIRHTPERDPAMFRLVQQAYEALRDEEARMATRLFWFDRHGRTLAEDLPLWLEHQPRPRMSPEELAEWIRKPE